MFKTNSAFSSFSVKDMPTTKKFYSEILGLKVDEDEMGGLNLHISDGSTVYAYQKDNHEPASFTILNFMVPDIDQAVDELTGKGVKFERYEGFEQDEKGISRGGLSAKMPGPSIAWFKDPSGNILAIIEE